MVDNGPTGWLIESIETHFHTSSPSMISFFLVRLSFLYGMTFGSVEFSSCLASSLNWRSINLRPFSQSLTWVSTYLRMFLDNLLASTSFTCSSELAERSIVIKPSWWRDTRVCCLPGELLTRLSMSKGYLVILCISFGRKSFRLNLPLYGFKAASWLKERDDWDLIMSISLKVIDIRNNNSAIMYIVSYIIL